MPSPHRNEGSGSKIAYTRWEPQQATEPEDDDVEAVNNNSVPFHLFETEEPQQQRPKSQNISLSRLTPRTLILNPPSSTPASNGNRGSGGRRHQCLWEWGVRIMGILIIIGVSWIMGFMTRWGLHHYYVDPRGHCVTPVPYHYDPDTARLIVDQVSADNIKLFLGEFTDSIHDIGSLESSSFAKNMSRQWMDFGLDNVEIDKVMNKVPRPDKKIPSAITIMDPTGKAAYTLSIPHEDDKVMYSANAIGSGRLVYGHFGLFSDLRDLRSLGINFQDAVVMLKVNQMYHTGSMVRNAQLMGAKAVILFPDPFPYIISQKNDKVGKLPSNVTLAVDVKFVPGDPNSPYLDENWTMPRIPVVSISYEQASGILQNFTNAKGLGKEYTFALPLNTTVELNFTARVEVYREDEAVTLNNVIGTIMGRYEPTRYVIVGSHHDSRHEGASRPGVGHAVLMELVRTLGFERMHGWKPGRSIIFASWDGEEEGQLGSTAWMYAHAKELSSRAVVYIDLDHLLQGDDVIHITASPLLKQVIMESALSVECREVPEHMENAQQASGQNDPDPHYCTLFDTWFNSSFNNDPRNVDGSPFQSILGISSLEVAMKNHNAATDLYPFTKSDWDTKSHVETYLDLTQAASVAKFIVILILKLVSSPKLPLSAADYGNDVKAGVQAFMGQHGSTLNDHGVKADDIKTAASKFTLVASKFNNTFEVNIPSLEMLGFHEYNDQLMELERAFLLPPSADSLFGSLSSTSESVSMSTSTYRHLIHGPSPLDGNKIDFLPRLRAALELAKSTVNSTSLESIKAWNVVRREAFYVVDALESASCVLDNHLIRHDPELDDVLAGVTS